MTRGTTPSLSFTFDEIDINQIAYAEITMNQKGRNVLIKKLKRTGKVYYAYFSETDTLSLSVGDCLVQAKVKLKDGNVIATDIETITINDVLNEEVML